MNWIKTVYIWHDCFIIRTAKAVLVFDFWKDPYQKGELPNPLMEIDRSLPLYVFVSHGHKDHYNPEIFGWSVFFSDIRYIVSKDVMKRIRHIINPDSSYKGVKVDASQVIAMKPGEVYVDGVIKVHSFASTDIGNSYAVEIGGYSIFHAGDLNAWIWMDESTDQEVRKALGDYNAVLGSIGKYFTEFDLCFFPVDSRIGTDYFSGARIFLERFRIGTFFPMHYELGEDAETIARLHRDAAAIDRYASENCRHYVMSAPYSCYVSLSTHCGGDALSVSHSKQKEQTQK